MRFKLSANAKSYLQKQDMETIKRIYNSLRQLTQTPPKGDIKPLQGSDGLYRLRIGDLRIIYEINGNNLIITKIAPRGQAYNK